MNLINSLTNEIIITLDVAPLGTRNEGRGKVEFFFDILVTNGGVVGAVGEGGVGGAGSVGPFARPLRQAGNRKSGVEVVAGRRIVDEQLVTALCRGTPDGGTGGRAMCWAD